MNALSSASTGTLLWRHFMNTNTGMPKSSSMKPFASHSWPEPQIAQTEYANASDATAESRTSLARENRLRSRMNNTTSAAAAYAYAISVIQVASRTMSVKRSPKLAFQL